MQGNRPQDRVPDIVNIMSRRLRVFKALAFFFAASTAALTAQLMFKWIQGNAAEWGLLRLEQSAPYSREVKRILKDLRYSGLPGILRPDVSLQLNFPRKSWRLANIHRFDAEGRVVLDEGRYGVCGDLAGYVYQQIQPIFDHRYSIRIVNAAEAGFFPASMGTHMVLKIIDLSSPRTPKTYILDPAFRVYENADKLFNYRFYGEMTYLDFVRKQVEDEVHPVNHAVPIRIRNNTLLSLMVGDAGGQFDPENYTLALTATKKNEYVSRAVFAMRRRNGEIETTEDGELARSLLDSDKYEELRGRLKQFFHYAAGTSVPKP